MTGWDGPWIDRNHGHGFSARSFVGLGLTLAPNHGHGVLAWSLADGRTGFDHVPTAADPITPRRAGTARWDGLDFILPKTAARVTSEVKD